jgi:hypothetical protein
MKPIALICDSLEQGIHYALNNLKDLTYWSSAHAVVRAGGIKYILIYNVNQVWGYEFSDWKDIALNKYPSNHYVELIEAVKSRIR